MKKKRRTGWIWILVLLLGAGAFYYFYWRPRQLTAAAPAARYSEYTVSRGTVSVSVTGSGLLAAAEEEKQTVTGGLKIRTAEAKAGDRIAEGDVLYTLDPDTLETRILAVSNSLADYRRTLMRYSDYDAVYAPGAGRVKIIYGQKGELCRDVLLRDGCLAVLSADELMALDLQTDAALRPGDEVQVSFTLDGRTHTETGTVEKTSGTGCTVTLPDTLAPNGGAASVKYNGAELGSGTLYIHMPLYVYNTAGAIKTVDARLNTAVNVASKLFTLAEDVASDSYVQAVRERDDAAEELLSLLRYRNDPVIRASYAGVLSQLTLGAGDVTVKDAAVALVHTGGAVKMTVDIDETDIPGLKLHQAAQVTLDAYPDEPFAAEVTRLPVIGVQSGSITVYKAELTLPQDERLLEGMHGSAVITLNTHADTLTVPVAVLEEDERGTYVLLPGTPEPGKRYVKTGISDGTYTEITEGLSEGDTLLYIPRGGTDMVTKAMTRRTQMMGGFGG